MPPQSKPVQPELEGMPQSPANPNRKYAFGGFIKAEIYDVFGELPTDELTQAEKDWFTPRRLEQICLVSHEDKQVYNERERFAGVLLSAYERTALLYAPENLGNRALARTLNASTEVDEEAIERSKRSSVHAIERKVEGMKAHTESLTTRRSDIIELHKEARAPGYAHKPKERMQQLFSASWQELLNLVDILQEKRGYDDEQKQKLLASAVNYLTTGPQKDRVKNWKELLEFQIRYLNARVGIFERRIKVSESVLEQAEV